MPDAKPAPASGGAPATSPAPAPTSVAANGNGTPQKPPVPAATFDMPKPSLRGLNKPKCIQCGNVARSRCPFQSCKSCCYKAQNPCHIHVLKQTNVLPDKPAPATASVSEQPANSSPSTGSSSRLASLQRLPHHLLNSLRTRKSIAKKDVASINKWRFMKLREYMQGETDAENEAYERYTQNVGLLEETFCPKVGDAVEPESEEISSEEKMDMLVSEAKVRLKLDNEFADSFKERIAMMLQQKLKKLVESQMDDNHIDPNLDGHTDLMKFATEQKMERTAKINELLGKLTRARSDEDLKTCRDIITQLFGKKTGSSTDWSNSMESLPRTQDSTSASTLPYCFPKSWARIEVDENFASKVNDEFSSWNEVVQL